MVTEISEENPPIQVDTNNHNPQPSRRRRFLATILHGPGRGAKPLPLAVALTVGLVIRFAVPRPAGVTVRAWQLLALFLFTVSGLVVAPLPTGAWSMVCLALTLATRTLSFSEALTAATSEVGVVADSGVVLLRPGVCEDGVGGADGSVRGDVDGAELAWAVVRAGGGGGVGGPRHTQLHGQGGWDALSGDQVVGGVGWKFAQRQVCTEAWGLSNPVPVSVVGSKWVYKVKYTHDGNVKQYKARLVAKGYTQIESKDFKFNFSHVPKLATIRVLIALIIVKKNGNYIY